MRNGNSKEEKSILESDEKRRGVMIMGRHAGETTLRESRISEG